MLVTVRRLVDQYKGRVLIGEIYLPIERLVQYYGVDLGGEFKKYGAVILLDVLVTILTHEAFITDQKAIEFGFVLGREWIDAHLSESTRVNEFQTERQYPQPRSGAQLSLFRQTYFLLTPWGAPIKLQA